MSNTGRYAGVFGELVAPNSRRKQLPGTRQHPVIRSGWKTGGLNRIWRGPWVPTGTQQVEGRNFRVRTGQSKGSQLRHWHCSQKASCDQVERRVFMVRIGRTRARRWVIVGERLTILGKLALSASMSDGRHSEGWNCGSQPTKLEPV